MISTKTVEDLINAYIDNNPSKIITILEHEVKFAKQKGKYNVAGRLKRLINRIPNKNYYSAQEEPTSPRSALELSSGNLLYERINPNILLEEVVLEESARYVVSQFLKEWEDYIKLSKFNIYPSNKLLFYGPPGTGKTRLAYAIANKLDFPLILVRLDELISSYLGKTGKNIREIFDIARQSNVVILLDEIDTIAKHRNDDKELGELKRVVTVLLQNIDNFPQNSIIIGATNNEDLLDKAVWRRFSIKLEFHNPEDREREMLFQLYLSDFPSTLDFKLLARLTPGFNGSMIYDLCQSIKKQTILEGKEKVDDLDAIKILLFSNFFTNTNGKFPRKQLYEMCQILKDNNFPMPEIARITGIAYTTLRDNLN